MSAYRSFHASAGTFLRLTGRSSNLAGPTFVGSERVTITKPLNVCMHSVDENEVARLFIILYHTCKLPCLAIAKGFLYTMLHRPSRADARTEKNSYFTLHREKSTLCSLLPTLLRLLLPTLSLSGFSFFRLPAVE